MVGVILDRLNKRNVIKMTLVHLGQMDASRPYNTHQTGCVVASFPDTHVDKRVVLSVPSCLVRIGLGIDACRTKKKS